jgi:hypothetical protein
MKKISTLICFIVATTLVKAQPTITTADLPFAGVAWTIANDTNYYDPILPGGANVTWDYSGLINQYIDTAGFMSAVGTPYAATFPTSNLASFDVASGGWGYYTTNTTGFYQDGFSDATGSFRLLSSQLVAPVPFTYGNTRSNTARIVIDTLYSGQNIRVAINVQSSFEADGYGTVILPTGTFSDVLRVKVTEVTYDSISAAIIPGFYVPVSNSASQVTHFRYFKPGITATYLLNIEADSLGQFATSSGYQLQSAVASVPTVQENAKALPYPNPVNSELYFNLGGRAVSSITFIAMDGKHFTLPLNVYGNQARIDVNGLPDGIYFYRLGSGAQLMTGKITVQH